MSVAVRRFAAIAALVIFAVLAASRGQDSSYCQALHGTPSLFCSGGPGEQAPGGFGCEDLPGQNVWACNLDSSLVPPPTGLFTFTPAPCGVVFCALDAAHASQQAAAIAGVSAADPRLSCMSLGTSIFSVNHLVDQAGAMFDAPGAVCVGKGCDACSDGQGGTLQNVGEHCGVPVDPENSTGVSMCCSGLVCQDPYTGQPLLPGNKYMGQCQGTLQCSQPQAPNWQPLPTTMLRQIAVQNKVDGCDTQSGITQSRTIGLAFEKWVLTTLGVVPSPPGPDKNTASFMSAKRKAANNNGLPASVIPEFVGDQTMFPKSVFYEVKAVTGALTPGTSRWQILGLLDVAHSVQPVPAGLHPAVFFVTTGNTTVSTGVLTQATMPMWNVAVWQQPVLYDANGGSNPNLTLGPPVCLTPNLCMSSAAPVAVPTNPGPPISPLTSPTTPPSALVVPGDPDPPEVD